MKFGVLLQLVICVSFVVSETDPRVSSNCAAECPLCNSSKSNGEMEQCGLDEYECEARKDEREAEDTLNIADKIIFNKQPKLTNENHANKAQNSMADNEGKTEEKKHDDSDGEPKEVLDGDKNTRKEKTLSGGCPYMKMLETEAEEKEGDVEPETKTEDPEDANTKDSGEETEESLEVTVEEEEIETLSRLP